MIVTGEIAFDGVYATWQEPEESVQDEAENVPDPLLDQLTVPVGVAPVTVAVHADAEPSLTGDGEQVTEMAVAEERVPKETAGITPFGG